MHLAGDLNTYLTLSGMLFAIGSFGFLARRNAISMLMSIELMLNAVNLAIVAFGAFIPELKDRGAVIALMVIAVAAAEAMSSVLFNSFVLPFEIVSVLRLAAVIGGVYLAKREPGGPS